MSPWVLPNRKDNTGFVLVLERNDPQVLVYRSWTTHYLQVRTPEYVEVDTTRAKEVFILLHASDGFGSWGVPDQHIETAMNVRVARPRADCYAVLLDGRPDHGLILNQRELLELRNTSSTLCWVQARWAGVYRRFASVPQCLDLVSDATLEGAKGPLVPGPGDPFCHVHGRQKRRPSGMWICPECQEASQESAR